MRFEVFGFSVSVWTAHSLDILAFVFLAVSFIVVFCSQIVGLVAGLFTSCFF